MPKTSVKQNSDLFYANANQSHVDCSCSYKLACVDVQFRKPFKLYPDQNIVHKFIIRVVKESKYCSPAMRKTF